jgi:hypothetical protein
MTSTTSKASKTSKTAGVPLSSMGTFRRAVIFTSVNGERLAQPVYGSVHNRGADRYEVVLGATVGEAVEGVRPIVKDAGPLRDEALRAAWTFSGATLAEWTLANDETIVGARGVRLCKKEHAAEGTHAALVLSNGHALRFAASTDGKTWHCRPCSKEHTATYTAKNPRVTVAKQPDTLVADRLGGLGVEGVEAPKVETVEQPEQPADFDAAKAKRQAAAQKAAATRKAKAEAAKAAEKAS